MPKELLLYFPLFIIGMIAGFFYYAHMWKSIHNYGTSKHKLMCSMIFRLPFPLIAVAIGWYTAHFGGIIAVIVGFSVFQVFFLMKKGAQLRKEVEEEAKKYNEDGTLKEEYKTENTSKEN